MMTPKGLAAPAVVRSIMKGQSGGSKKRRVVFAETDVAVSISSSDDEECLPKTCKKVNTNQSIQKCKTFIKFHKFLCFSFFIFLFVSLFCHFLLKKKGADEKEVVVDDRKVPSRANKPNVRHSPKPASWKDGEGNNASKPQQLAVNEAKPLKPVPRGKPIRKPKKVVYAYHIIREMLFQLIICSFQ